MTTMSTTAEATRSVPAGAAAIAAADAVIADLVSAALARRDQARVTDAPAGAGKTGGVITLVGAQASVGARVGVVTQTNAQAFDVVERLADTHRRLTVGFMPATSVEVPRTIHALANVHIVEPATAGSERVVVATADKWAYARDCLTPSRFNSGVIDEAYQMTSAKLLRIAELFESLDLVGDPGQLDPFSIVDDEPWAGLPVNPVQNAVSTLLANHPHTPRRSLPVTRRLPSSAAGVIREAFYPDLAFGPATGPQDRALRFTTAAGPGRARALTDAAWTTASANGWAYLELSERLALPVDREIVNAIVELVERLFARGALVVDERTGARGRRLTAERVAVGVSHRNQRAEVTIALQRRGLDDVVVDTANRLQGREFDVVIVWHPLAGRTDASAFHLDAGRMCVLTTRHRQACVVVGRAGVARLLADHPPPARVTLGAARDPEFDGWEAHTRLLEHLEQFKI